MGVNDAQPRDGRIQLFVPHSPGCYLVAKGRQQFVVHPVGSGPYDFRRRKDGRRGGGTMWHLFCCNDTGCTAVAGVRWDALAEFIAEALGGAV